jgi:hypothetical protein
LATVLLTTFYGHGAAKAKSLKLPLPEIASVFVRVNHIARCIVNADHSIIALEIESAEH